MNNSGGSGNTSLGLKQVDGVLYAINADTVERCLTPTTSSTASSWDTLANNKLVKFGTTYNWAMDGSTIYVDGTSAGKEENEDLSGYTDTAATAMPVISAPASGMEVAVDPVTGRGIAFTIVIDTLGENQGKINRWDYKVWDKAAGKATAATTTNQSGQSKLTSALGLWPVMLSNTTYVFQVRGVQETSGETAATPWSDTVEVTVQTGTQVQQNYAGPQILGPQGGGTTGLNPGFAWAPVAGATKYQFIVATDAALTNTIGGTPVEVTMPSYQVTNLDYGTTYFWAVKVVEPTPSQQTISTFTTMDKPAESTGGTTPATTIITQEAPPVTVNVPESTGTGTTLPMGAIWAIIAIGAVLIVSVLVLIVRTRRPV